MVGTGDQSIQERTASECVRPSLMQLVLVFLRLGTGAFGGPAMVHYIRQHVVLKRRWLDEDNFRDCIVLGQSVPGAAVMHMAALVGLKVRGAVGAVLAFVCFILPGALLMLALSAIYVATQTVPHAMAVMAGLQVIVVALMLHGVWFFGRTYGRSRQGLLIAVLSLGLLALKVSPFWVLLAAAAAGAGLFRGETVDPAGAGHDIEARGELTTALAVIAVLAVGTVLLWWWRPRAAVMALLMMKIDVFAFGGGSTTIPLLFHEFVSTRGWLTAKMLVDGIALGQITPGPIVITSTFVGYVQHGLVGGIVGTAAMFLPSFAILMIVAPHFERVKRWRYFTAVSKGTMACFAGLLLFMTLRIGVEVPWSPARVVLGLATLVALYKKVDMLWVVPVGAVISWFVL